MRCLHHRTSWVARARAPRRGLLLVLLLTVEAVPAEAQPKREDLAALLACPVSPGSIALLVAHGADPAAQTRLSEALKDSRPEVRAVAARVAFATKSVGLLTALRAALTQERDDVAAGEIIRAVMTLGGRELHDEALAAAEAIRGYAVVAAVETMARLGVRDLKTRVASLLPEGPARELYARLLVAATKGDAAMRVGLLRDQAVATDAVVRTALFRFLRAESETLPSDVLLAWLQGDEAQRVDTIWYIAQTILDRGTSSVPPEVMTALAPRIEATRKEATWEALGLEVIARRTGQQPSKRSWLGLSDAVPSPLVVTPAERRSAFDSLTDGEREEIGEAAFGGRNALALPKLPANAPRRPPAESKPAASARPVRTVPPFVGGLWQDLSDITGCRPGKDRIALATLIYHPEGRPRAVGLEHRGLPEPCLTMVSTLFSLTLSPVAEPTSAAYVEVGVVPLTDTTVACASEPPVLLSRLRSLGRFRGGTIRAPKKTHDVRPFYPKSAIDERVEGEVFIDAMISPTGCVSSARVTRSADTRLDLSALVSVAQWRYTPTLVEDQAVPVTMTVTVSFFFQQ